MCSRFWLTASPPLRPASRASPESNSWAVPFACAALPPLLAISFCLLRSIEAKPRLLRRVPVAALDDMPSFWLVPREPDALRPVSLATSR
jgi:hypothetical protein